MTKQTSFVDIEILPLMAVFSISFSAEKIYQIQNLKTIIL